MYLFTSAQQLCGNRIFVLKSCHLCKLYIMATGRSRDASERLNFHPKCTIKVVDKYEGVFMCLGLLILSTQCLGVRKWDLCLPTV